MYYLKDFCFMCIKNNRKVQSVLLQDTDGIVFNEKLICFFPEIIDSIPDEHKLACSECLEKLRISYNFKQSVIRNNTVFRDYIDKLKCQHKSYQKLLVVLARSKRRNLPFPPPKIENCDEKHNNNSLKIQNKNLNLTSIKQEQLNKHDQSCQLTTNEKVGFFTKQSYQPEETNLTEEIYIKVEPLVDRFTSNKSDEESNESEESNSTSSDSEFNDQPKQTGTKTRLYKCDECHKAFNTSSTLERHRRIHSGEKPHQCDVCNKAFNLKTDLIMHRRNHDNNQQYQREIPYQCHICLCNFFNSSSLKRHIRTHTGEKPYQCHICKFKCAYSSSLRRHTRSHTGEKPYQCSECSKSFANKGDLTKHMRIHTGEKPYQCHICEFKCADHSSLVRHRRTHTGEKPYHCSVCSKTFVQSSHLTKHMRLHTGKTFHCYICELKFSNYNTLKCHIRTHTGDKSYQCKHCKKSFASSRNLRRLHTSSTDS